MIINFFSHCCYIKSGGKRLCNQVSCGLNYATVVIATKADLETLPHICYRTLEVIQQLGFAPKIDNFTIAMTTVY